MRHALLVALGLVFVMTGIPCVKAEGPSDIAPTGTLRVAVAVGPAASAFWTTRDPATGKPRGVTVELAKAAADKLHVPRGKAVAKAWAAHFLDEAKADGTVRRALDGSGFTSDKVAP